MTDQVTENNQEQEVTGSIFQNSNAKDQKAASDHEAKSVTPDIDSIFKDKLGAIMDDKGEQKYKDVFTALDALKYTQDHVKTLEEENRRFREEATKNDTLQQALNNISAKDRPEPTKSEGIDADKLKGMTLETLMEYERTKTEEKNKTEVSDALIKKYGDRSKAEKAYSDKAAELGIDLDTFVTLAAKSPKAVLSYFDTKTTIPNPSSGSINSAALQGKPSEEIDYMAKYYSSSDNSLAKWRAVAKKDN